MRERNYPTRVHELLGVEPMEIFKIRGHGDDYHLSESGVLYASFHMGPMPQQHIVSLINDPSAIIRKLPLTQQQADMLKALYTLGYPWLVKSVYGAVYAAAKKPHKWERSWRSEDNVSICINSAESNGCLTTLVSWDDDEPFDIAETLIVNGVLP